MTKAQAPSLSFEEFAAVIVPFLSKAGFKVGILSFLNLNGSSSSFTYSFPAVTGTVSKLKAPFFIAYKVLS